jgi:hypothetical protein
MVDQTFSVEQLTEWGTAGTGVGSTHLAGLTSVEASGVYQDPVTGVWIMTYFRSELRVPQRRPDPTGYATATDPLGPWTAPAPATATQGGGGGRRDISAASCGGQPDTVTVLNGQAYELIDLWTGSANETGAGILLEPLTRNGAVPSAGRPWQPFTPWTCA